MRNKILGFAVLALASVMGLVGTSAEARQAPVATERTGGEVVGASVAHPTKWNVEREPYTSGGTYGYTLWYPDTAEAHDHGGEPALRVALAYGLEPGDIDEEVDGIQSDYPDLPLQHETVAVARRHEGIAVGPIPGSTPFTRVYVPVGGRVYSINVYSEDPDADGLDRGERRLLSGVRFERPSRSVGSLDLPAANSMEELYPSGAEVGAVRRQEDGKVLDAPDTTTSESGSSVTSTSTVTRSGGGDEKRIAEGCWRADPSFYVQTQHGYGANGSSGDGIPTGWSKIGIPNFWGQYTHGDLGYGRCTKPYNTNDKFAVDYPLNKWNYVFSPFKCGRVTYAGRNQTHADYGIFVSIKACNGKYVNLSAHLSALKKGLSKGDEVTENSVIGYAGDTGGGNIPVGRVHVHTVFYRYPKTNPDGSPYGGAGLKVVRNRYFGTSAEKKDIEVDSHAYKYGKVSPKKTFCLEGIKCGERYLVSN